ncbi:MAG: hypothetical protein EXQ56_07385 [Acidobacteria bacterium]|nr:hypothetical protein [Acidobacteriota bacterium]
MSSTKKMRTWKKWLLRFCIAFTVVIAVLGVLGYQAAMRIEPFIREQTALYLRQRFDSEVEIGRFDVGMSSPLSWPVDWRNLWRMIAERGRVGRVAIDISDIALRHKGRRDLPALLAMKKLSFVVNVDDVLSEPPRIRLILIDGININIPPKGERPGFSAGNAPPVESAPPTTKAPTVVIDQVVISNANLKLLPRNQRKPPLEFDIQRIRLDGAWPGLPFVYDASLVNAKPPGQIESSGKFGPWVADEPGESAIEGEYIFQNADLGVFKGVAGILNSTGTFRGQLNRIIADGETDTPDFRLTSSGNAMPLHTKFHAVIDGTNGNTALEPVEALLGKTKFTARGSVDRDPDKSARSMLFYVLMKDGRVDDVLRLAMKGDKTMLTGGMNLDMCLHILPESGDLADRLNLSGTFELVSASFMSDQVQQKIDELSRKGQGRPKDTAITNVASNFYGDFILDKGVFDLHRLEFDVPGALVQLNGNYLFETEAIDFHGQLRLQAKLSKTQTGWKRILLTPVDPFFSKEGAGTLLNIQVVGTRSAPQFGLDKAKK